LNFLSTLQRQSASGLISPGLISGSILLGAFSLVPLRAQGDPDAAIVSRIDTSVHAREQGLLGYTVTEHYAVFRNHDEQHPVAEMMVRSTYQKDAGKNYNIVSETGSALMRKVLEAILDNEKRMSVPANRVTAVISPANYDMTVKGSETVDGRNCLQLSIKPKRMSQYLLNGTVWVDAQDGSIVQLLGVTAKSPSVFAGASQVLRQYTTIDGFPMATHVKAVSNSWLVGQTIIKIDYTNYQIQLRASE
jgi:hypothetical protein